MEINFPSTMTQALQRSISQCEDYTMMADAILRPIAERLGASAGAFFQLSVLDDRPLAVERADLEGPFANVAALYSQDLFRNDPLFSAKCATPTTLRTMLATLKRDRGNDSYQRDLLIDNGIGDIVGIHFPLAGGTGRKTLAVSFPRHAGMPDYTENEVGLLGELAPSLRLALCNVALAADAHILGTMVTALAGRLESEIRLIDERTGIGYACRRDDAALRLRPCDPAGDRLPSRTLPDHLSLWMVPDAGPAAHDLTLREWEVVQALRAGHSNPSMAHALGISVRTVENHLRSIYAKIGVNSRTQLVMKLVGH